MIRPRFAVLFMRLHPLHFGHLNLIKCISKLYESKVRVIIGRESGNSQNPFPHEQRMRWLNKANDEYDLKIEIQHNVPPNFLGGDFSGDMKRKNFYFSGLRDIDIISGNSEVINFFSDSNNQKKYNLKNVKIISISQIEIMDFFDFESYRPEVCGSYIREKLFNDEIHSIEKYIPYFVYEDLANFYN